MRLCVFKRSLGRKTAGPTLTAMNETLIGVEAYYTENQYREKHHAEKDNVVFKDVVIISQLLDFSGQSFRVVFSLDYSANYCHSRAQRMIRTIVVVNLDHFQLSHCTAGKR